MEPREALHQVLNNIHQSGAKIHGLGPHEGLSLPETKKRSYRRACRRSILHGHAWYHGQHYTPDDFPPALCASERARMQISSLADCKDPKPVVGPNKVHSPHRRLKLFQWNPSGLSSSRYQELLQWLALQSFDVVCLSETRWKQDMEWQTADWTCIHTGDPLGHSGVLLMISSKLCPAKKVSWQIVQAGRLLHIRLHTGLRPYDLIGVYQWTSHHSNTPRRQALLNRLDLLLQNLPQRNLFAMMGDFNTSVHAFGSIVGTTYYTWHHCPTMGAQHADSGAFEQLLRQHHLCVLNAWSQKDGPTFKGNNGTSRIDFIICRQRQSDGLAKRTSLLPDMPMIPANGGHVPVIATVVRCWIPYKSATVDRRFTFRHRMTSRHMHVTHDPAWLSMISETQSTLQQVHDDQCHQQPLLEAAVLNAQPSEGSLHQLHAVLSDSFQRLMQRPTQTPAGPMPGPDLFHATVESKWFFWKQLRSLATPVLPNLFHAWKCWTRFVQLERSQDRVARQRKTQKVQHLTDLASKAAHKHDIFRLYQLINNFTPKQKRSRIQLRTHAGTIASPMEELAILRDYVKQVWFDPEVPSPLQFCPQHPPGVPFSQDDLTVALQRAPAIKAVAAPFPPNLLWKATAAEVAAIVYSDLQRWSSTWPPHVPAIWQRGWLVFIGKPNRVPNSPSNLRGLAMQEPVGKAILTLLTSQLQSATFDALCQYPQMAYTRDRDTQDALLRVVHHCNEVKGLFKAHTASLRNHVQGTSALNCFGGIQMFVDLEKAFDQAPRAAIMQSLALLNVPDTLISLFGAWHANTSYVLQHHDMEATQPTTCGVRQGCVAAPQLWCCLMYLLMQNYGKLVSHAWLIAHLTIFADDVHLCQVIRNEVDLQRAIDRFGLFIQCAHDLGLKINFRKTEVLLRLAGRFHSHAQSRHILRTAEGVFLKVPYGQQVAHIPLKSTVTYLGVCITYHNFQKATVSHRIAAGKHIFQRLRIWLSCKSSIPLQKRFQLWQQTVFAAMSYGLLTTGIVPQGLQLLQTEIMRQLRLIAGNFAQLTSMTHFDFLRSRSWPTPACLLLKRVEGLIQRCSKRFQTLATNDIVLQHQWTHLSDIDRLLRQAMAAEPTAQALHSVLHPTELHVCYFCTRTFHSLKARQVHMWQTHHFSQKHFRPVDFVTDTVQSLPYCHYCDVEFDSWKLFSQHMALHVDSNVTQVIHDELTQQLASGSTLAPASSSEQPSQSVPAQNPMPVESSDAPAPSVTFRQSSLFDKARATEVGARALQLIHDNAWNTIKTDDAVKQWLSSNCVVCNIVVGGLKRMNMHMRQHHQALIDGLYQTAGTVLKRCGTASPCEFCGKEFQVEHLCPAIIQASMVLMHELPSASDASAPAADPSVDPQRCRRIVVHDFVLARDSLDARPQCSHCRRKFDTLNGLKLHISLGKCPQFDINRSRTPVDPDAILLQHLKDGQLMLWLADAHRRMQWTCHCKTCGVCYKGTAPLSNHLQMAHADLWHSATTCTSFLSAYVHTIHRCVCNPSPGHMRTEHQCMVLRQIAMQYIRARDAGQFPELFLPYRFDAEELSAIIPFAPADFCSLLHTVTQHRQLAPLWTSPFLSLLSRKCMMCGFEATDMPLAGHLTQAHSLALNSAMMLHANLAAMALGFFQSSNLAMDMEEMDAPPLAQLADVFRHMGPLLDKSTVKILAPKMDQQDTQPAKRAKGHTSGKGKNKGRGKGKAKEEEVELASVVKTLGRLVLRLDLQHRQQSLSCCLICFLNNRQESVLQNLVATTAQWKVMAEQNQTTKSLRSALWETTMGCLMQRVTLLAEAKDDNPMVLQAQKVGLLLKDRSWPFQEWNSHKQQLVQSSQKSKTMDCMMKCLQALDESSRDGQLVLSFHTMKPMPQESLPKAHADVQVFPWRLVLNPRDDDTWNLLCQLQGNAIWNLVGMRYKQANLRPSNLTQQLEAQLRALS
eukprot:s1179_g18.t1